MVLSLAYLTVAAHRHASAVGSPLPEPALEEPPPWDGIHRYFDFLDSVVSGEEALYLRELRKIGYFTEELVEGLLDTSRIEAEHMPGLLEKAKARAELTHSAVERLRSDGSITTPVPQPAQSLVQTETRVSLNVGAPPGSSSLSLGAALSLDELIARELCITIAKVEEYSARCLKNKAYSCPYSCAMYSSEMASGKKGRKKGASGQYFGHSSHAGASVRCEQGLALCVKSRKRKTQKEGANQRAISFARYS